MVFFLFWYSFYMKYIVRNLDEMQEWANNFLGSLQQKETATIIALSGDLGAGKTTLAQNIGQSLGIKESITSPTFVIQKEYSIDNHGWIKNMIHIDAYRLERKEDLEYLGWHKNIQNSQNIIIIEWPEMVAGIDMPEVISLHIEINDDHSRGITQTGV